MTELVYRRIRNLGMVRSGPVKTHRSACRLVRVTLRAVTAAVALVGLALGGAVPAAAQPDTIRGLVVDSFARIWEERLVPEFSKKAPNVKVVIDAAPYGELLPKQMLELTRKPVISDFLITDDPWVPQLAATGLLAPLKETFQAATKPDYD